MIDDPHLQDMVSASPAERPGQSAERDRVAMAIEPELAEALGALNLVSAKLVGLVARIVEAGCWDQGGVRSPTHYVCWQTGFSPARARQVLRLAIGLTVLPVTRAAFEAGELTADQADVVVKYTPPAHDARACELARQCTVPQLGRAMRALSPPDPSPEATETNRRVSFGANEANTEWHLLARLPIDEGATAEAALRAARDRGESWADTFIKIFEASLDEADRPNPDTDSDGAVVQGGDDWNTPTAPASGSQGQASDPATVDDPGPDDSEPADANREAETGRPTRPGAGELRLPGLDTGDGPCPSCGAEPDTACPTPARLRHRIWFHLEAGADGAPTLSSHPDMPLPQAIARDLTCDGLISPVTAFGVGRSQRIVPERTRRKVEHRDKGCRYPGCHLTRVQVHHIIHWLDHGETEPPNLLSLCARHHRLHHLGAYDISGNADDLTGLVFTNQHGQRIEPRPPPKPPPGGYTDCERSATWAHPTGETLDTHWITPPTAGRAPPPNDVAEGRSDRST